MHINVLHTFFCASFSLPLKKGYLHPFNMSSLWFQKGGRKRRKREKILLLLLWSNDPHQHLPRDIQMGFFCFTLLSMQALKWIHLHLVSGLRILCRAAKDEERKTPLFRLKNGICYALIKWRCCTFISFLFFNLIVKILPFQMERNDKKKQQQQRKKFIG